MRRNIRELWFVCFLTKGITISKDNRTDEFNKTEKTVDTLADPRAYGINAAVVNFHNSHAVITTENNYVLLNIKVLDRNKRSSLDSGFWLFF